MTQISLKPGEKFPEDVAQQLTLINKQYSDSNNFLAYKENIRHLFCLEEPQVTKESKLYLGGFLEGEGSLSVSCKKLSSTPCGIFLDPEFNVTQHVNGVANLYLAMCIFQTGRIYRKSGSDATLVFRIFNRKSLMEKVIPFYDKYVIPYGSDVKQRRKVNFVQLLVHFEDNKHKNIDTFVNEMLPLWDALRMQTGNKNQSFPDLEAAREYVYTFARQNQEKKTK